MGENIEFKLRRCSWRPYLLGASEQKISFTPRLGVILNAVSSAKDLFFHHSAGKASVLKSNECVNVGTSLWGHWFADPGLLMGSVVKWNPVGSALHELGIGCRTVADLLWQPVERQAEARGAWTEPRSRAMPSVLPWVCARSGILWCLDSRSALH